MPDAPQVEGLELTADWQPHYGEVLTPEALTLLARLQREFGPRRAELLRARAERDAELAAGALPDFLDATSDVRGGDWQVAPPAPGLVDRRVEITGPTDRKMVVNALNSGAKVFMADFEDSNTPTFDNLVTGQLNLRDALRRQVDFTSPEGKSYALGDSPATLVVRTRGWHLPERHVLVDGEPVSGSLFDFCLFMTTSAQAALDAGQGPYFYLPKMESHLEARLWNDVFVATQEALGIPRGTIRATCLIETILAAFEMEEILYELREHSSGLNAGRWDYIFSMIKKFRTRGEEFQLPDRSAVTMTVPFMRAYTELLVKSCHTHGAHAIGGMAAFIPNRRDPEVTDKALAAVRADKSREAADGFDGSWVAHPDLVPVALEVFDEVLGERPDQRDRRREDVVVTAAQLLDAKGTPGEVTEAGLRNNVSVGVQYLEAWLRGSGAVAIFNLMEDAATAEISRSQVWQWVHNGVRTAEGELITPDYVRRLLDEELAALAGDDPGRFAQARELFEQVALADDFEEFLTLPAYERLGLMTAGLAAALRSAIGAERVLTDRSQLRTYECDGLANFRVTPAVVVLAESRQHVVDTIRLCAEAGVPFVARGSGTGLSGGALPSADGVLLVLSRLRSLGEVDADNARIVVEPGVINLWVTRDAAPYDLAYAPDPSSQLVCSIGGNVAENAGGAHCLKYGFTVNHVMGAEVVLPDGSVVELGGAAPEHPGYDLLGAFVGSEGTLGVATSVTLRLVRVPEAVQTMLVGFASVDDAAGTVSDIIAAGIVPAAIEMMDALAIEAAEAAVACGYPAGAAAVLVVELDGPQVEVEAQFAQVQRIALARRAFETRIAADAAERALMWKGRKSAFAAVGRISPAYFVQDGVIPRTQLPQVLAEMTRMADDVGLRVANVFHAGDGNLHPLVLFDDAVDGQAQTAEDLAGAILDLCISSGGSITGEHGVGHEKRHKMSKQFTEADLDTMQLVRCAFDPDGIANPGKVFPTPRLCGERPGPRTGENAFQAAGLGEVF